MEEPRPCMARPFPQPQAGCPFLPHLHQKTIVGIWSQS